MRLPTVGSKEAEQAFPFFKLPAELRLKVYAHLFTESTVRLKEQMLPQSTMLDNSTRWCPNCRMNHHDPARAREHHDSVLEATHFLRSGGQCAVGQDPPTHLVALFMACRQMYNEALPLFYREAYFHWSIRTRIPMELSSFQNQLSEMRHLSLDFSYMLLGSENRRGERIQREEKTDIEIAKAISYVAQHCPNLRTFELHLLSDYSHYEECDDFIQGSVDTFYYRTKHTVEALKGIKNKVRDAITIIAVAGKNIQGGDEYRVLLEAIAPKKAWSAVELRRKWPSITLTDDQALSLEHVIDWGREIRMWSFLPKQSKANNIPIPKPVKYLCLGKYHSDDELEMSDPDDTEWGSDWDTRSEEDTPSEDESDEDTESDEDVEMEDSD